MTGIVIKSTGSWYNVLTDEGITVPCRIVGKFKQDNLKLTNPIAVGDNVQIEMEDADDTKGIIKSILPRKKLCCPAVTPQKASVTFPGK